MYYHVMLTEDQLETLTALLESQRSAVYQNLSSSDPAISNLLNTVIKEINEIQVAVDSATSLLTNAERTPAPSAITASSPEVKTTTRRRTSRKTPATEPSGGLDKQSRKSVD